MLDERLELMDALIEDRWKKLDYGQKQYFKIKTLELAFNLKHDLAKKHNESLKWWQRKVKVPPLYKDCIYSEMVSFNFHFTFPAEVFPEKYEAANILIRDYMRSFEERVKNEYKIMD